MASSLYGHGGFDNISADSHLVLNYGYNVYVDVYNFFIDIINEVV